MCIRDSTSTAIIDPTSNTQTEVNEYGPVVTARELHAFMEKFTYIAKGADVVIVAGSLPRKVKDSFYKDIIGAMSATGVMTVLDTAGEPLRLAIKAKPGLVSPNIYEACLLYTSPSPRDRTRSRMPSSA